MTILEDTRSNDKSIAAPHKALVVKSGTGYRAEQGSDYEPGVSAETVGSKSLWLGMITLPPGKRTRAHVHEHHETALYVLSGDEMELWTGDQLQYRDVVRPGDYIFIPANVLHVAVTPGVQPAVLLASRNEPTAPMQQRASYASGRPRTLRATPCRSKRLGALPERQAAAPIRRPIRAGPDLPHPPAR